MQFPRGYSYGLKEIVSRVCSHIGQTPNLRCKILKLFQITQFWGSPQGKYHQDRKLLSQLLSRPYYLNLEIVTLILKSPGIDTCKRS